METRTFIIAFNNAESTYTPAMFLIPGANRVRSSASATMEHFDVHQGTHILQVSTILHFLLHSKHASKLKNTSNNNKVYIDANQLVSLTTLKKSLIRKKFVRLSSIEKIVKTKLGKLLPTPFNILRILKLL